LTSKEIYQALRDLARVLPSERTFFVIGSQAIHATFPDPPGDILTISPEVDVYIGELYTPQREEQIYFYLLEHMGSASDYDNEHQFYVDPVRRGVVVPILPNGWRDRAVRRSIDVPPNNEDSGFSVDACFIEIHDLIASKLSANRPKDRDFVREAFARGMFDRQIAIERLRLCQPSSPATIEAAERFLRQLTRHESYEIPATLDTAIDSASGD
jgi:hypothetical protein